VFATDLNEANLEKARHGFYPKTLAQDVSPERLRRFFIEEKNGYQVIKPLRELVVFARQNLMTDPPFSRMDLISCRNVMIYLEPTLQKKALPAFHYALKPDGVLFLGASESVGTFTDLFAPVDKRQKIFFKQAAPTLAFHLPIRDVRGQRSPGGRPTRVVRSMDGGLGGAPAMYRGELNAEREADRVTMNQFAPPGVLINPEFQILQFRGPTDAYLRPPTGKARFDLLTMAREGLMLPLRLHGRNRFVNVAVIPLKNLPERRFLVLFADPKKRPEVSWAEPAESPVVRVTSKKDQSNRIAGLERDLAETRDYLQSFQENQDAANEELQMSNEEGQSANEELQSLNEELETSKEELESTNEELTTVNEEMAGRNVELSTLNSDLTNLQTSTHLVIVLLGRDLAIRRFSPQAEKQFHLHASDVGRTVGSVGHNLDLPDLDAMIAGVIRTVRECEREVRDNEGRWYSLRVRPYLDAAHRVDGAVLVLMDIDVLKRTEARINEEHEHAEAILRTVPNPLIILDADLRVHSANEAFYRSFQMTPAETHDRTIFQLDHAAWDFPRLRQRLRAIIPRNSSFDDFELIHESDRLGRRVLLLNARVLIESDGKPKQILLGIRDVTERQLGEDALRLARVSLAEHTSHLEELVAKRTAQLTAANKRLEASVHSNQRSKEKYRVLFLESQAMQKKLRHVARLILAAQEEERKEISRELHDEVVQTLVGINVELSALGASAEVGGRKLKDKIVHTQQLVEHSVQAVHRFARGLRPAVLDDLGLIPALHAYSKSLAARKKFKIELTADRRVEQLDSAKRTVLYRVAQEALTNVARHARATRVKFDIRAVPDGIRMEIRDNGQSFQVGKTLQAANNKRLGLVGMKERVEMVGGSLVIESTPRHGTSVSAEIPFKGKNHVNLP
jgi:PAS domain S-box-containing protein